MIAVWGNYTVQVEGIIKKEERGKEERGKERKERKEKKEKEEKKKGRERRKEGCIQRFNAYFNEIC